MRQYVVSRFVVFRPFVIVSVIVSRDTFATSRDVTQVFAASRTSISRKVFPSVAGPIFLPLCRPLYRRFYRALLPGIDAVLWRPPH
jgi:hypothetical protein